jgi:hypothetical protein
MKRGPKNAKIDLLQKTVREIFFYDKKTGLLRWKIAIAKNIQIGTVAGAPDSKGRIRIGINYRRYLAHRIIWLWVTGKWPEYEIDHEDGVKYNNAWTNLREATPTQNHFNIGLKKHNTSGYKGVSLTPSGTWHAKIRIEGKQTYLGTFSTAEDAYRAYCEAAKKHHGKFARL